MNNQQKVKNIRGNIDIGFLDLATPGIETFPNSVYEPGNIKLKTGTNKLRSGVLRGVPRQVWTQAEIENKIPFSQTGKTEVKRNPIYNNS